MCKVPAACAHLEEEVIEFGGVDRAAAVGIDDVKELAVGGWGSAVSDWSRCQLATVWIAGMRHLDQLLIGHRLAVDVLPYRTGEFLGVQLT